MGYIYKITNTVNGKAYVGKTQRTIKERWQQHIAKRKTRGDLPLYRAMNKYGVENFTVEQLEQCEDSVLDEREIYWIKELGTYGTSGYNATGGGEGGIKDYHECIDEIIDRYKKGERLDRLCKEFHCDYASIRPKLIAKGVEIDTHAGPKKMSKRVVAIDPITHQVVEIYDSISAAARAISTGQNPRSIANHISKQKDYGNVTHEYLWKTADTIPDIDSLEKGDVINI